MNTLKILFAEIRYRKLNFLLSLVAVMIAVSLFVAGPILVDAYQRETTKEVTAMKQDVAEAEEGVQKIETSLAKLKSDTEKKLADMKQNAEDKLATMEEKTAADLADMEKKTRRLMRDMGFNLMIVHSDTDMTDFWASDFAAHDMPQDYVNKLAADPSLTLVTHLVATLQGKITYNNRKVLLVGYLPESTQSHRRHKSPMGYRPEKGNVYLGYELGVGKEEGETIEVLGKEFKIAKILPEQGSKEDISIIMHLNETQEILDKPERINQIMALGCHCAESDLPKIRKQLADILPDTRITEFRSIALARAEQRDLVEANMKKIIEDMKLEQENLIGKMKDEQGAIILQNEENLAARRKILEEREGKLTDLETSRGNIQKLMKTLAGVITPLVIIAAAIWVGLLALMNVRERRTEIGILRAIGKGPGMIARLFIGKALMLGLFGAIIGLPLGMLVAIVLGSQALGLENLTYQDHVLLAALIGAPIISAIASYLPTLSALSQDPAVVLREH